MQNRFGKKLEEARTRRGVSIRQASDDLKIRSDFLLSFENDNGNFLMPIVYKTGFIKLYARYLKLNPDEIGNDFTTYQNFDNSKNKQKEERETLGRIALIDPEPLPSIKHTVDLAKNSEESEDLSFNKASYSNKSRYTKIGLTLGTACIALILIAFVVNKLIYSSGASTSSSGTMSEQQLATQMKNAIEELTLSGEDNIHIVVRQEHDKKRLFSGNIDKTHPITLSRQGPVKIHFSDGSKLTIEKPDGKKINPGRNGKGWIEL